METARSGENSSVLLCHCNLHLLSSNEEKWNIFMIFKYFEEEMKYFQTWPLTQREAWACRRDSTRVWWFLAAPPSPRWCGARWCRPPWPPWRPSPWACPPCCPPGASSPSSCSPRSENISVWSENSSVFRQTSWHTSSTSMFKTRRYTVSKTNFTTIWRNIFIWINKSLVQFKFLRGLETSKCNNLKLVFT